MKATITLNEAQLRQAVTEYLEKLGYKNPQSISFARCGWPDSSDPREQAMSYSVTATFDLPPSENSDKFSHVRPEN